LVLTSFHPVLFLLTTLLDIVRGDISGIATCMIHSGLAFILTIYCMHLMYALYQQRKMQQDYETLDMKEKGPECDPGSGKTYQSFLYELC
jgi:hypothetical protein